MQVLLKILSLLLAIQLSLISVGKTDSSYGWHVIQSMETPIGPLEYPAGYPDLYAIHHQGESPAEITNRVPQPQPNTEQKYEPFRSSAPETVIEQWLIFHIKFADLNELGLTTRKLIFPFHYFL